MCHTEAEESFPLEIFEVLCSVLSAVRTVAPQLSLSRTEAGKVLYVTEQFK
jgi:hypothetical protein